MFDKNLVPGDLLTEINVFAFLSSIGIQLAAVAMELRYTDNMYAEKWDEETAERFTAMSEMCAYVLGTYTAIFEGLWFKAPDGMMLIVSENPFRSLTPTPPASDEADDVRGDVGEIPF